MKLSKLALPILAASAILLTGCGSSYDEIPYRTDLNYGSQQASNITGRFMNDIRTDNATCSDLNSKYINSCKIDAKSVLLEMGNFGTTDLTISVRGDRESYRVYCDVKPKKLMKGIENDNCDTVFVDNFRILRTIDY